MDRREFIARGAALAAGAALTGFPSIADAYPARFAAGPAVRGLAMRALDAAKLAGAKYADVRVNRNRNQSVSTRERQITGLEDGETFGFGRGLWSTVTRPKESGRSGFEAEHNWALADKLRLTATYAYLDATQPDDFGEQVREARRPKHSGSIAADGAVGRVTYGLSLAYTGARRDTDFEVFPFRAVRLDPYWLTGARIAYAAGHGIELFARAQNAFDARYQDALGYRTEGRSVYAGIRVAPRR